MQRAVFIGDELTAAGFRLTGLETVTPGPEDAARVFADARARASLVVVTAEFAAWLPAQELEAALLVDSPTIAVIPDVLARVEPAPLAQRVKSILGLES